MLDIKKLLDDRNVPDALVMNSGKRAATAAEFGRRREEIKDILTEEGYGVMPNRPDHLSVEVVGRDDSFAAGRAPLTHLKFICSFGDKEAVFPVSSVIPKSEEPLPAFVMISFSPDVPDRYLPAEEIADRGFAVFSFCYTDISSDDGDFSDKLAKYLVPTRRRKAATGKIAIWAWAAMRVMDYVERLDCIDRGNIAVIGHSLLGKASLLAGGFDERFKYIISNSSGSYGAAISRGRGGEAPIDSGDVLPFHFCPRWLDNTESGKGCTFDQNFLISLSVPRHIMIGSAEDDLWTDPRNEFLGCASANSVYELYGRRGLVHGDEIPTPKTVLGEGDALYHIREGLDYLSREDWQVYMDYIDKVMGR